MDYEDKQTKLLLIRLEVRKLRDQDKISSPDFERLAAAIDAEERRLFATSGALVAPSQETIKSVVSGLNELRDAAWISPDLADRVIRSYTQAAMTDMKAPLAATEREVVEDQKPLEEREAPVVQLEKAAPGEIFTMDELQRRREEILWRVEWLFFCENEFRKLLDERKISSDEYSKLKQFYERNRAAISHEVADTYRRSPWPEKKASRIRLVIHEVAELFGRNDLISPESQQAILMHYSLMLTAIEKHIQDEDSKETHPSLRSRTGLHARSEHGSDSRPQSEAALQKPALFERLERAYLMSNQLSVLVESDRISSAEHERLLKFYQDKEADIARGIVSIREESSTLKEQVDYVQLFIRELDVVERCLLPETLDKLRRRYQSELQELQQKLAPAGSPAEEPEAVPIAEEVSETPKVEGAPIPKEEAAVIPVAEVETKEEVGAKATAPSAAPEAAEAAPTPAALEDAPAGEEQTEPVSLKERLIEFFVDERTIKGMISLGVLLALAGLYIFLRQYIHTLILSRYFQFSVLFLLTLSSFFGGCLTITKTEQKMAGRGLLLLGSLLVPMDFWYLVRFGVTLSDQYVVGVGVICAALYAGTGFLLGDLLFVYLGAATAILTSFVGIYRFGDKATAFPSKYAIALTIFSLAYITLSHIFGAYERTRKRRFDVPFYVTSHVAILIGLFFYTKLLMFLPPGFLRLIAEVDTVSFSSALAIFISLSASAIYCYSALYHSKRVWAYFFAVLALYSVWLMADAVHASGWSTILLFAFCALVYKVAAPLLRGGGAESASQRNSGLARRVEILSKPLQHLGDIVNWVILGTAGIIVLSQIGSRRIDFTVVEWRAIATLAVVAIAFGADVAIYRRERDVYFFVCTLFAPLLLLLQKAGVELHTQMPIFMLYFITLRVVGALLRHRETRWSFVSEPMMATSLVGVGVHLIYAATRFRYFCIDEPYAGALLCLFYLALMLISLRLDRHVFYSYAALVFLTAGYLLFLFAQGFGSQQYPLALAIEGVVLVFPLFLYSLRRGRGKESYKRLVASPIAWFTIFIVVGGLAGWVGFDWEDIAEIPMRLIIATVAAAVHFGMVACMKDCRVCSHVAVGLMAATFNLVLLRNSDLINNGAPFSWFHFPLFAIPFGYLMLALSVLGGRRRPQAPFAGSDRGSFPNEVKDERKTSEGGGDVESTDVPRRESSGVSLSHFATFSPSLFTQALYNVSQAMCMIYLGVCLAQWGFFLTRDNTSWSVTIALFFTAFYVMSTYHFRQLFYSYMSALTGTAAFLLTLFLIDLNSTWYPLAMMVWCFAGMIVGARWRDERLIAAPMRWTPDMFSLVALLSAISLFFRVVAGGDNESYFVTTLALLLFSAYHLTRAILSRNVAHSFISFTSSYLLFFVVFHWAEIDGAYYLCGGMALSLIGTLAFDYLRRSGREIGGITSLASRIVYEGFSCVALIIYLVTGTLKLARGLSFGSDTLSVAVLLAFMLGAVQSGYLAWSFLKNAYGYVSMFCVTAALLFGLTMTELEYYQLPYILALHPLLCATVAICLGRVRSEGESEGLTGLLRTVLPIYAQCTAPFVICFQLLFWRETTDYHFYAMITALEMSLFYGISTSVYRKQVFSYLSFTLLVAAFSCFLEFSELTPRRYYGLAYSLFVAALTVAAYVVRGPRAVPPGRTDDSEFPSAPVHRLIELYCRPVFNACAMVLLVIAAGYAVFWRTYYYGGDLGIVAYSSLISSAILLSFAFFDVRIDFLNRTATIYLGTIFTTFSYATLLRDWGTPSEWFGLCFIAIGAVYFALGGYFTRKHSASTGEILFRKGYIVTAISAALSIYYPVEATWVFLICSVLYGINSLLARFDIERRVSSYISGCALIASYVFLACAIDLTSQYYAVWSVGFPALLFAVSVIARQAQLDVLFRPYLQLGEITYAIAAATNLWFALIRYPDAGISMIAILAMICLSVAVCRVFAIKSYFNMAIVFAFSEYWLFGHYLGLTLADHTEYYSVPAGIALLAIGWLQIQRKTSSILASVSGLGNRLAGKDNDAAPVEAAEPATWEVFDLVPYNIFLWSGALLIAGPMFYHSVDPAIRQPWYIIAIFVTSVLMMGWGKFVQWKAPLYTGMAAFVGRLVVLVIKEVEWGGTVWVPLIAIGASLFVGAWLLGYKRDKLLAWKEGLKAKRDAVLENLQKWK